MIGLVVASVFHATPVLGAILTRQEFSGDFTLVDATSPFLTNSSGEVGRAGTYIYQDSAANIKTEFFIYISTRTYFPTRSIVWSWCNCCLEKSWGD
ncbi:hypothetical protein GXM_09636 [Nostoc sphaeroides CCNUC1]|uniref:Uncharacterized protein n=1 Tax=Nostoc sphaeroides CCNUC1 TaxID=2653204 RepID=A0A5P8WI85_9NOSO|nr:hypothetical protein GXM_09636 [Nostoc sphaeroides CCNUC1]